MEPSLRIMEANTNKLMELHLMGVNTRAQAGRPTSIALVHNPQPLRLSFKPLCSNQRHRLTSINIRVQYSHLSLNRRARQSQEDMHMAGPPSRYNRIRPLR